MTKGTMVAVEPKDVPTIKRVNGITATKRMMKGTERRKLTIKPRTALDTDHRPDPCFIGHYQDQT